jgi:hypothetical protein
VLYKHHTDGDDDDFTFFFYGNFGAGGIKVIPTCFIPLIPASWWVEGAVPSKFRLQAD